MPSDQAGEPDREQAPTGAVAMLAKLVPAGVATAATRSDVPEAALFPQEAEAIARAVPWRWAEFATGRFCAREAMQALGLPPVAIPVGDAREPRWPEGVVGSITHCRGFRAAAVARTETLASIGIDAEPAGEMEDEVVELIARPEERALLAHLHDVETRPWERLLFCVKEAVFKAWFPVAGTWLDFLDVAVDINCGDESFKVRPATDRIARGQGEGLEPIAGRWSFAGELVLSVAVIDARHPASI